MPPWASPAQRRALTAIARCRTPALGGHVYRCTDCAGADFAYHSCGHRACPRCGGAGTAAWTQKQTERLLPVPYFLVTFTVPAELRAVFSANPALLHDVLFAESAATLQQVAAEPRLLGAELGFVGVLHTWGRQLQHQPHVHYIVPGGGLRADGKKWVAARQADWLLPVKKLAAVFRARMEASWVGTVGRTTPDMILVDRVAIAKLPGRMRRFLFAVKVSDDHFGLKCSMITFCPVNLPKGSSGG